MLKVNLKDVEVGDFFRFEDSKNAPLWIRGCYERISREYSCISFDDYNHLLLRKGSVIVFVEI